MSSRLNLSIPHNGALRVGDIQVAQKFSSVEKERPIPVILGIFLTMATILKGQQNYSSLNF
jgi:hypothetical protein